MGMSNDPRWYGERVCVICGKTYIARTSTQKTCSKECSQILNKQTRDKHLLKVEAQKAMGTYENPWHKTYDEKPKPRKRQPKPKLSVVEIAVLARAEGMTYGQYVAKYNI